MMQLALHVGGGYTCPADPGEVGYNGGTPRVSVSYDESVEIGLLCAGKDVLEIGTGLGVSTCAIAARARSLVTVDIDPWVKQEVWPMLAKDFPSIEFASSVVQGARDVVFIDGNHLRSQVYKDCKAALAVLREGGLLILHDFDAPDVREAAAEAGVTATAVENFPRLGVYRTKVHGIGEVAAVAIATGLHAFLIALAMGGA